MLLISTMFWVVGLAGLLVAAFTDLTDRIIPNRVVLLIAATGLGLRLFTGAGTAWISVAAAIGVLLILAALTRREIIGGGDAKLIPAVTLLVPAHEIVALLLSISIAGGLLSCIYLIARSIGGPSDLIGGRPALAGLGPFLRAERVKIAGGEPMPYAVAIFAGAAYSILTEAAQCFSATSC